MKDMKEAIRRLQKDGEYRFEGLGREESRKAAQGLPEQRWRMTGRTALRVASA